MNHTHRSPPNSTLNLTSNIFSRIFVIRHWRFSPQVHITFWKNPHLLSSSNFGTPREKHRRQHTTRQKQGRNANLAWYLHDMVCIAITILREAWLTTHQKQSPSFRQASLLRGPTKARTLLRDLNRFRHQKRWPTDRCFIKINWQDTATPVSTLSLCL